ncbi:MAG TPA: hypothetical protein VG253_19565 [Streptosporangiaceae bacterium]|nr:hypothetical protein [Streptosporangiaceae bacterium]
MSEKIDDPDPRARRAAGIAPSSDEIDAVVAAYPTARQAVASLPCPVCATRTRSLPVTRGWPTDGSITDAAAALRGGEQRGTREDARGDLPPDEPVGPACTASGDGKRTVGFPRANSTNCGPATVRTSKTSPGTSATLGRFGIEGTVCDIARGHGMRPGRYQRQPTAQRQR